MKKISDFNSSTEKYPVIYAGSATRPEFVDMPTTLQQQEGVAPMDTLPAQWWNAMWKLATKDINAFRDYVGDSITEINNLLTKFGITLDDADSEQLYDFFHNDYVQNYLSTIFVNKSGDTINGDLHIKGNLSVDGIGEEIISTELKVGSNTITLRNGNPSALGNTELAGVVTNNYDGNNHNNIISIDKNGVARTGDIDIATRILYSNNRTNFFTDEGLTIPATIGETEEVRDTGNQTSGGVKIYEGITYSNNDTQAIATREDNPVDGALMKWNAATKKLVSAEPCEHNGIFRGKCLNGNPATMYPILPKGNTKKLPGGGYTIEQVMANIAAGNFDDIYIGDYFIDSNINVYRIAGLDTELNKGDTPLTSHHAVIVTDFSLTSMGWNPNTTTAGGYQGSAVQAYCDRDGQAAIESVFGAAHVLTVRDLLSSDMNASAASPGYSALQGAASDWGWFSHKVRLMSEVEVYGTRMWSGVYDIGTANEQFPLFRLMPQLATGLRYHYWLSGIGDVERACFVIDRGDPDIANTRYIYGVRVRFLVG